MRSKNRRRSNLLPARPLTLDLPLRSRRCRRAASSAAITPSVSPPNERTRPFFAMLLHAHLGETAQPVGALARHHHVVLGGQRRSSRRPREAQRRAPARELAHRRSTFDFRPLTAVPNVPTPLDCPKTCIFRMVIYAPSECTFCIPQHAKNHPKSAFLWFCPKTRIHIMCKR